MFILINSAVFSNDSIVVLGSTVEIMDKGKTNISMLDEVINITLHKGYYEVDVTFDFYNDGPTENILLGFPVRAGIYDTPEDREWAQINDFKSYINGNLVTEYTVREEEEKDFKLTIKKWFIREVTFPGNSHTESRVTYKAPYNMLGFYSGAGYIYGTGRCWKGPIGKMTLIINHGDDTIIGHVSFGYMIEKPFRYSCEANGKHKFVKENVELGGNESIEITREYFDIYGEYDGQFESKHVGWVWDEYLLYENLTYTKLFTRNQVRLFINFFYARHGYDFKNSFYKNYFKNVRSYYINDIEKVNTNISENDFNEFERKNIDYLLNLEKNIPFDIDYLVVNLENDKLIKDGNGINKRFVLLVGIIAFIALVRWFFVRKKSVDSSSFM
jgi:hypothetical protein